MNREKSQVVQLPLAVITLMLVLSALSMIWPAIIALCIGILMLLQSFIGQQEIAVLSWAEISDLAIAVASLRRPDLPAIVL